MKRNFLACLVGLLTLSTLAFGVDTVSDYILSSRANGGRIILEPKTAAGAKTRILTADPATGRIGIGSETPGYKLDVAGDANISTGSVFRVNGTSVLSGSTLGSGVTASSLTSVGTLGSLTTTGVVKAGDGAVGAPSYSFGSSGNTDTGMYLGAADQLRFSTAGADRVTVLADGKVGIGSATPGTELDVVGAIQGSTSVTAKGTTNQLVLGTTNTTTISSTAPAASRVVTLPDAGTNSSLVLTAGTQTIGGTLTLPATVSYTGVGSIVKAGAGALTLTAGGAYNLTVPATGTTALLGTSNNFSVAQTISAASNQLVLGTTNTATINNQNTSVAGVYTIPANTATSEFVMGAGNQTIAGTKTFSSNPTFSAMSTAGLVHNAVTSGALTSSLLVNADVSGSAAIDGSKLVAASASVPGVITTVAQTLAGVKTFNSAIEADISKAGTVAITSTGAGVTVGLDSTAGDDFNVDSGKFVVEGDTGYVGIGTTAPAVALDVVGSVKTSTIVTLPAGETLATTYPTVNVAANPIDFKQDCATGYIKVPKDNIFTFQDFCVMKYHAKGTAGSVVSTAADAPYVSITQYDAKNQCATGQTALKGAHLITPAEWMTIARNIEATAINDIDAAAGIQLATGHSDDAPANAIVATTDPSTASCVLTVPMSDAANASCAFRTATVNTGPYYLTTDSFTSAVYSSGGAGKSQMRTHFLSNGQVIWDMAGNVWNWTDMLCNQTNWYNAAWTAWSSGNLTDWEKLVAGPSTSTVSAGGAGQYYGCTANGNGLLRGGTWDGGTYAGVFAASLGLAPSSSYPSIGFRCAYAP